MGNLTPKVYRVYALHAGDFDYRYVGLTSMLLSYRLGYHLRANPDTPFGAWKHSVTVHIELLEECDDARADEAEEAWIVTLRAGGHQLFNRRSGGRRGFIVSDETRALMGGSMRGRERSPEASEKAAAKHRGTKRSDETKARMSEAAKKREPPTEDTKQKIRDAKLGVLTGPPSQVHRDAVSNGLKASERIASGEVGRKAMHVRWHVNRNLTNPDCEFCEA